LYFLKVLSISKCTQSFVYKDALFQVRNKMRIVARTYDRKVRVGIKRNQKTGSPLTFKTCRNKERPYRV
jgi:hypothetical protein